MSHTPKANSHSILSFTSTDCMTFKLQLIYNNSWLLYSESSFTSKIWLSALMLVIQFKKFYWLLRLLRASRTVTRMLCTLLLNGLTGLAQLLSGLMVAVIVMMRMLQYTHTTQLQAQWQTIWRGQAKRQQVAFQDNY